ncbi:ABC transporter permease [Rhizobium calliandrae]|uniref:ABC transporter permease n=2 Tax=Rhizobium TaxID=379 RepID=A0A387FQL2_9HYPH|nr:MULTISPECIES: ABC transporter permease [Rhizobium]AYG59967.1 ABC transporter permease [Rhizobium jaguaris]MDL2406936.1 ABC transporter permease [Rhizobium calliandrae]
MKWTLGHIPEILLATAQHLWLSGVSVVIGFVVAAGIAVYCAHRPRAYAVALVLTNLLFVLPSLALFAFLIPFLGLGQKPVIVGLSSYSLVILLRNMVTGMNAVPQDAMEAARGLGFRPKDLWLRVELPLSAPFVISGLRIASVTVIGIATIGAFIDGGGLGTIILTGLDQNRAEKIIVGCVLISTLALLFDKALQLAEQLFVRWR